MHRVIQNIYMLPLFTCVLFSLRSLWQKWAASYKTFSILLICVFLVELMAILWKYYFFTFRNWPWTRSNLWLYNSFLIPQYLLYIAVYYRVLHTVTIRRWIIRIGIAYSLFALVNLLFIQHIHAVNSFTLAMADSIVLFLTIAYFEQLRNQKEIVRLTKEPMVWISLGAFIYHGANLPFLLGLNFLISNNMSLALALFYIYLALNCIMYSLYTIAFLCRHPPQKS